MHPLQIRFDVVAPGRETLSSRFAAESDCSGFGKRQEILSNLRNYLVKVRRMFQPIEYLLVRIRADAGEFCEAPGTVDQVFCLFRPQ